MYAGRTVNPLAFQMIGVNFAATMQCLSIHVLRVLAATCKIEEYLYPIRQPHVYARPR